MSVVPFLIAAAAAITPTGNWQQIGATECSYSGTGDNLTPVVTNTPKGTALGDIIIAIQQYAGTSLGGTPVGFVSIDNSVSYGITWRVSRRIADGTEGSTIQLEDSVNASRGWGILMSFRRTTGVNSTPAESASHTNYATLINPFTAPTATATFAGGLWLTFYTCGDTFPEYVATPPSGHTQVTLLSTASSFQATHVVYKKEVDAGATGTADLTWGHGQGGSVCSFILRPA